MRSVIAVTVGLAIALTGCILRSEPPEDTESEDEPPGPGPGIPEPDAPRVTDCSGAGDCSSPPIAVGGTGRLTAQHATVTSGPFEWIGDYTYRATAAGVGTLGAAPFSVQVVSRPLAAVRLGPLFTRAPRFGFVLDGETPFPEDLPGIWRPLALHVSDPHGVIRLWSTEYDRPSYGAERIVDTSLRIASADPGVHLTSWDVIAVPPVAGTYRVVLAAASFGNLPFDLTVVDHIDRLEAQAYYTPRHPGDTGIVCFHARTDDVEVAIDMELAVTNVGPSGGSSGRNCLTFEAASPGTVTVTATAGAVTGRIDFAID